MKRRELLRHLNRHDCVLLREGSNHSWWVNPLNSKRSAILRHSEIRDLAGPQDL
jgi:mRNA interferase HicA